MGISVSATVVFGIPLKYVEKINNFSCGKDELIAKILDYEIGPVQLFNSDWWDLDHEKSIVGIHVKTLDRGAIISYGEINTIRMEEDIENALISLGYSFGIYAKPQLFFMNSIS